MKIQVEIEIFDKNPNYCGNGCGFMRKSKKEPYTANESGRYCSLTGIYLHEGNGGECKRSYGCKESFGEVN